MPRGRGFLSLGGMGSRHLRWLPVCLIAALASPARADETSTADKLRILYSSRFTFTAETTQSAVLVPRWRFGCGHGGQFPERCNDVTGPDHS